MVSGTIFPLRHREGEKGRQPRAGCAFCEVPRPLAAAVPPALQELINEAGLKMKVDVAAA